MAEGEGHPGDYLGLARGGAGREGLGRSPMCKHWGGFDADGEPICCIETDPNTCPCPLYEAGEDALVADKRVNDILALFSSNEAFTPEEVAGIIALREQSTAHNN